MAEKDHEMWKSASRQLIQQRQELDREGERQRMLDTLASTTIRNNELEAAVARLAREQDRLVLAEQERILKRAQVAHATSALLHEANWAKNRMENEMRLAKQRTLLFPETVIPGSLGPDPIMPKVSDIRPFSKIKKLAERGDVSPSERGHVSPSERELSASDKEDKARNSDLANVPTHLVPPSVLTQPVAPSIVGSAAEAASIVSTAFGGLFSQLTVPEGLNTLVGDVVQEWNGDSPQTEKSSVAQMERNVAQEEQAGRGSVAANVLQEVAQEGKGDMAKPEHAGKESSAHVVPENPVRFAKTTAAKEPNVPVRTVNRGGKGEWTNPELLAEAELRTQAGINERVNLLQAQRTVMKTLFGLPQDPRTELEAIVLPEWTAVENEWLQNVKNPPKNSDIDPAVAATDENHTPGIQEETPDTHTKKKGCLIM